MPDLTSQLLPRLENHQLPGNAHEVRHRQMRAVQHRREVRVQGRSGFYPGAA